MGNEKDLKLQQAVLDELEFDPRVEAAHIGVSARNGVVTLTGHVTYFSQKVAAEEAAARVHGVTAVAQQIEVEYPFDKKHADDEIAARAVKILEWSVRSRAPLHVSVEHGVVTLGGTVEWEYQRRDAESQVNRLGGVRGIANLIKIVAKVDLCDVQNQVRAALERAATVEADSITIESPSPHQVTLRGRVRTLGHKVVAESAAWKVPGVERVDNHLQIGF